LELRTGKRALMGLPLAVLGPSFHSEPVEQAGKKGTMHAERPGKFLEVKNSGLGCPRTKKGTWRNKGRDTAWIIREVTI